MEKVKFSLWSFFKFAIGWPLSAIALFFVGKIIFSQQKDIVFKIEEPNIILLASGITCFFLFYLTRSFVWKLILQNQGYNIPLKTVSYLWEISELKRFVPGNIWSFLGRTSQFLSINVPTKTIVKALIIETESFLLAAFIISILGGIFYSNSLLDNILYAFLIPLLLILFLAILLFVNSYFLTKYLKGKFLSKIVLIFPSFPPKKNALILAISIFYLLLFGLGTYLTVTSVVPISPKFTLSLSAFFVFSLLVGYLSIVTPMGLGVRESVIIVGLSQFIPLGTAAITAIFARLVLIISELLFLLFTYLWRKTKNKFVDFLENFIVIYKQEVILGVLITIYILYFTAASFLRYDNFYTGRFDLGNMDQTVWNTINGRIFELTDPNGTAIVSRLAFHADFILILLAPFYLIWEHPKMLLLIQTIVLSIGAVFVYAIGKNVVKNKNLSLVFAFLFLLNPTVQFTNLYDFHAVTLATTFLLGAFYFLRKYKYIWLLIFLILAGITKEQVWIIIAIFGLYIFFRNVIARIRRSLRRSNPTKPEIASLTASDAVARNDKNGKQTFGIALFLASSAIFYSLIWHAIPNALGSDHFALSYYSDFGDSPTSIVKNVLLSPQKTFTTLFQKDQLSYLSQLFVPLGLLSFLSPLYLIFAFPDLFINLLSGNSKLHQIYYQYSATITPFIFIAAIFGVRNLIKWFPKIPIATYTYCLLLTVYYSAYAFGPLPFAKHPNIVMFTKPQENRAEIENFISNIPVHYSVAATNNIGSHLSQRQEIFTVPNGIGEADIIIFLLNNQSSQQAFESQIEMINENKNYKQVLKINNSLIAFEKQAAP